ncbi:MAG TPA: DUF6680 family protein [Steroidobacteraceae bacterium]|jgi:hypothetical protein|nr:DUF6680 family protein [Steroidobacteraceae bacterium]
MWNALASLKPSDWVLALAALAGPVLAVQAQKWVERWRERAGRKLLIFQTLMTTRSWPSRLTIEHSNALNMIDLVFYGRRRWGRARPTKTELAVTNAWNTYRLHLNSTVPTEAAAGGVWTGTGNTLFSNLLVALAADVRYDFQRDQLSGSVYQPSAQGNSVFELTQIRHALLDLLNGNRNLNMDVKGFPAPTEGNKVIEANTKLAAALEGGALKVKVEPNPT